MSSDATVDLIRALVEHLRGAPEEWESLAIVLDFSSGRFGGTSGYAYSPSGAEPVASRPSGVQPAVDAYVASHYQPGDALPVKILVQLDRTSGRYNVEFEDTDPDRWKVTPATIDTIADELRPDLGAPQQQQPSDNDPAMVAELDRLNDAVRNAPPGDTSAQIALWQQAARLDRWFFIARGTPERPQPYAIAAEAGPMICLYSSAERANEAARSIGLVESEGASVPLFAVPMPAALDHVASYAQAGVFGVTLDHPRIGHFIPLANLQMLKGMLDGDAR